MSNHDLYLVLNGHMKRGTSDTPSDSSSTVGPATACLVLWTSLLAILLSALPAFAAADWPPMEPSYGKVTSENLDGVPAVILFRKAYLRFRDYPTDANSQLDVQVRVKILTEEGTEFGNVEVAHSRWLRLDDFEGRTIAADGRTVPLSKDQIFEEQRSRRGKEFVTKAAFPAVEPGAIVDYRYTLYWDDLFYLEPWYFQGDLPSLLSEITYFIPGRYAAQPWGIQTTTREMQSDLTSVPGGKELRVWIENAPKIPEEPYSPPDEVLSSRFMMVPKSINVGGQTVFLMDRWESVSELFQDNTYKEFHRRDGDVKKKAKELTRGLSSPREKAETLFRFVRDEIRFAPGWGVWPSATTANETLKEQLATAAETALLLRIMLDTVGIESDLIWGAHRDRGLVDLNLANPALFDGVFLRIDMGDGPTFLDATHPGLSFGQLAPGFEGMAAVALHSRKPETLELPKSNPSDSQRNVTLELTVQDDGRLTGKGTMERTGQWAWNVIFGSDDLEAVIKGWTEALQQDFPTLEITEVKVTEDADASKVDISWAMAQREDEVLGDEVSFNPASVLRASQHFESQTRRTPVELEMNRNDKVSVTLTWPEGWEIEAVPEMVDLGTPVGNYWLELKIDEAERKMTYERAFIRPAGEFRGEQMYGLLRELYEVAARTDASNIALYQP